MKSITKLYYENNFTFSLKDFLLSDHMFCLK